MTAAGTTRLELRRRVMCTDVLMNDVSAHQDAGRKVWVVDVGGLNGVYAL